jgi:hypothetical protein
MCCSRWKCRETKRKSQRRFKSRQNQYVSPKSSSCASTALRLGGRGANGGGGRICRLCFRACPGGGRPETRLATGSSPSGCCRRVCSDMLCAERWRLLWGETGPLELWRLPYEGPPMELRGRCVKVVLGAGMSRKFELSGVSAPERLPGRALPIRLLGRW